MTHVFIPGLELARLFYQEAVAPVLADALDGVPYSAALIGAGSEVQGFDTERSMDHAWGPRLQVFLDSEHHRARAEGLEALLERELPQEFRGFPVRFAYPFGTPDRHWVHLYDVRAYVRGALGGEDPLDGLSVSAWLTTPAQVLRELTGGEVFHDGTGLLRPYRAALAWYPDDLWRHVLAAQWMRLSQEEPFVGRCGEVGDDLGSAVVAARQVRDLMRLCLLMDRVYPPYSKWLGTAFARLDCARELAPLLSAALAAGSWQQREEFLTPAYESAARLCNGLGLTAPVDPSVRYFHDRPFLVLDSFRFADALVGSIADPAVRALPRVGAYDQYVDNTDMGAAEVRGRYIAGP